MDFYQNSLMMLPGITPGEIGLLEKYTYDLSEDQKKIFYMVYAGKRKSQQDILLFTLLAFVGVSGVQRFITGQIGMGLLYFFTAGLCFIGTIVDLVNHKAIADEFNGKMAVECIQMIKMSS